MNVLVKVVKQTDICDPRQSQIESELFSLEVTQEITFIEIKKALYSVIHVHGHFHVIS